MNRIYIYIFIIAVIGSLNSCSKFLSEKPDDALATPTTLDDLQLLLDDYNIMNERYPSYAEVLSDNYYITFDSWNSLSQSYERDYYTWTKNADAVEFWNEPYKVIFQCNVILDGVNSIKNLSDLKARDQIIGSALFFRGYYLLGLSELYTMPYDPINSQSQIGLPIKLKPIVTEKSSRSKLSETYDRIINDLKESAALLPNNPAIKTRPSKSAAYGALAKCYLIMKKYDSAWKYSDLCINNYSGRLLNYNEDINQNLNKPFPFWMNNPEIIIPIMNYIGAEILLGINAKIDTFLFESYAEHDLRKVAYFRQNVDGSHRFKGNIFGNSGSSINENRSIALPEMYLIRAESAARNGNIGQAMDDLNFLLMKRFETGYFTELTANTLKEALDIILKERRKELLFTGARWTDIRRFKDDSEYSILPVRVLNGNTYHLPSNSPRFALQIPQAVIDLSGIQQNE